MMGHGAQKLFGSFGGHEAEAARIFEQEVFLDRDFFPRAAGRRIRPSDRVAAALRSNGEGVFAEPVIERADRPPPRPVVRFRPHGS